MKSVKLRYKYCQEAIGLKHEIEKNFLSLAEYLYRIKNEELWQECFSSWDEFCDEIRLNNSTIHRLMAIYSKFVLEYEIPKAEILASGGWSILSETVPLITSRSSAKAWLHKATELSLKDLRTEVREAKTGVLEGVCQHTETYIIRICSHCGQRERVY